MVWANFKRQKSPELQWFGRHFWDSTILHILWIKGLHLIFTASKWTIASNYWSWKQNEGNKSHVHIRKKCKCRSGQRQAYRCSYRKRPAGSGCRNSFINSKGCKNKLLPLLTTISLLLPTCIYVRKRATFSLCFLISPLPYKTPCIKIPMFLAVQKCKNMFIW